MPSVDRKPFPFAYHLEYSLQLLFNVLVGQYLTSIFGSPNEVVFADICTVAELIDSAIGHFIVKSLLVVKIDHSDFTFATL